MNATVSKMVSINYAPNLPRDKRGFFFRFGDGISDEPGAAEEYRKEASLLKDGPPPKRHRTIASRQPMYAKTVVRGLWESNYPPWQTVSP
jgi:hypothetical protein